MRLDYLKELVIKVNVLLLDISDLIWGEEGKKVMKVLLNIVITRRTTELTGMQQAESFFACFHLKRKMKSERKKLH